MACGLHALTLSVDGENDLTVGKKKEEEEGLNVDINKRG